MKLLRQQSCCCEHTSVTQIVAELLPGSTICQESFTPLALFVNENL